METTKQILLKRNPRTEKELYECKKLSSHDQQNSKFISMLAFGNRIKSLEPLSDHSYTLRCLWNAKKLFRGSSFSSCFLPLGNKVVQKSQVDAQNSIHGSINRKRNVTKRKNYFTQTQPEVSSSNICSVHKSICLPFPRCSFVNLPDNYLLPSFYTQKGYTQYISINKISQCLLNLSCGDCLLKIKQLKKNVNQSLNSFHYNILSTKFGSFIKKSFQEKKSEFHFNRLSYPKVKKTWNKKKIKTYSRKLEEKKMMKHLQSLLPAIYQLDSNSPDVILKYSAEYIKDLEEELKYSIKEFDSSIDSSISIDRCPLPLDVGPVLENISEKLSDQWNLDDSFKLLFPNLTYNSNLESTSASGKLMSSEELSNSITPNSFDYINEKTRDHDDNCDNGDELELSTNYFIDDILMKSFNCVNYDFDPCLLELYEEISSDTNMKDEYIYDDVNLNSSAVSVDDFGRRLFSVADKSILTSVSYT
ncbi:uncharacterized protein LOC124817179 isoform X4 [Hydra vulgaris]|uniref:Uncharacterized protein LOC124817179 isoform X4 n=1 Tax=Hydra vulgaris TaxID=6087 RepID=A0ABM4D8D9_HYDVU